MKERSHKIYINIINPKTIFIESQWNIAKLWSNKEFFSARPRLTAPCIYSCNKMDTISILCLKSQNINNVAKDVNYSHTWKTVSWLSTVTAKLCIIMHLIFNLKQIKSLHKIMKLFLVFHSLRPILVRHKFRKSVLLISIIKFYVLSFTK